jgi:hypothetical protein
VPEPPEDVAALATGGERSWMSSSSRLRSGHAGEGSWPPEKMSASSDVMLLTNGSLNSRWSMLRVASYLLSRSVGGDGSGSIKIGGGGRGKPTRLFFEKQALG